MSEHKFNIEHSLHKIKHYLPSQMTLKDFIHHNSLHAFQDQKFFDGIFNASDIFGYKVSFQLQTYRKLFHLGRITDKALERVIKENKGAQDLSAWKDKLLYDHYDEHITPRIGRLREEWKEKFSLDMDSLTHPLLYRILASYLDQGIAIWDFPASSDGFYNSLRDMEINGASFLKTEFAVNLLKDKNTSIVSLLEKLIGDSKFYEQYLFDTLFSHRGWSGMVSMIEDEPTILMIQKKISVHDLVFFELILEIDVLEQYRSNDWKPIGNLISLEPMDVLKNSEKTELHEVLRLWQNAFEWSYYNQVLNGIQQNVLESKPNLNSKSFQTIFCIDERECSIRRNLEIVAPESETLGAPGFFGVEFYFQPLGAKFYDKLCPAPIYPKYLIKEIDAKGHHGTDIMLSDKSHTLIQGILATFYLGVLSLPKLLLAIFRPKMSASISDAFGHLTHDAKMTIENKDPKDMENGLQIGFTIDEMAARIEGFLRGIGLVKDFSPIVYMMSHGSSSANNPHHGAHDCGACSGRPGCVNARVFALMANHSEVRKKLKANGLVIPDSTVFIGAMHDTASDMIAYYDDKNLNSEYTRMHQENKEKFESALDLNAKERSRRFSSISTTQDIKKIRKEIELRSVSLFEPRPELGHGTNSLCIVGRRDVTRGLFMDRRAFLNSYDYRTDMDGTYLQAVMRPIGLVCGGINLEYYFSRVDNIRLGCGTKLPHNVVGLIGVNNGSDGDLRPGLPWQMVEPHDPVRLLVIVEHFPDRVLAAIQQTPEIYEWYKNEWVHIMALHPEENDFYKYQNGAFHKIALDPIDLNSVDNILKFYEDTPEMKTNHITNATFENIPIHILNLKSN